MCRVVLDLAAQTVDLHVDCPLADRATIASERQARHGFAGRVRKNPQHLTLAVRQPDSLFALPQFAAREMIHEWSKADRFCRRWRSRLCSLENVGNAQRQFARFEWFREIIIGAYSETSDTALSGVAGGQHQDRDVGIAAKGLGKIETGFARHHYVEDEQIEAQAFEFRARIRCGLRSR